MMHRALCLLLFLALHGLAGAQPARYRPDLKLLGRYQQTITPQDLRAHLEFLASDELEGRETATRGQYVAARYIASWFQRLGLKPIGDKGTYYQHFELLERRLQEVRLQWEGPSGAGEILYRSPEVAGLIPRSVGPDSTGGLVLAGYGIVDPQNGRDDYAGLDPRGKWAVVLDGEPLVDGRSALTPDGQPSIWTRQWWQKAVAAAQKGAIGLLVVTTEERFQELAAEFQQQAQRIGPSPWPIRISVPAPVGFPHSYTCILGWLRNCWAPSVWTGRATGLPPVRSPCPRRLA